LINNSPDLYNLTVSLVPDPDFESVRDFILSQYGLQPQGTLRPPP